MVDLRYLLTYLQGEQVYVHDGCYYDIFDLSALSFTYFDHLVDFFGMSFQRFSISRSDLQLGALRESIIPLHDTLSIIKVEESAVFDCDSKGLVTFPTKNECNLILSVP